MVYNHSLSKEGNPPLGAETLPRTGSPEGDTYYASNMWRLQLRRKKRRRLGHALYSPVLLVSITGENRRFQKLGVSRETLTRQFLGFTRRNGSAECYDPTRIHSRFLDCGWGAFEATRSISTSHNTHLSIVIDVK